MSSHVNQAEDTALVVSAFLNRLGDRLSGTPSAKRAATAISGRQLLAAARMLAYRDRVTGVEERACSPASGQPCTTSAGPTARAAQLNSSNSHEPGAAADELQDYCYL